MKSQAVRPQKIASLPLAMTPMSGTALRKSLDIADLTGLAQRSLIVLAIMALGASGCLVTDSPDFKEPRPTPPVLVDLQPPPYELHPIEIAAATPSGQLAYKSTEIYFYVVSDDLQEPLEVYFLLDFKRRPTPFLLCPQPSIPAGQLDSPPRKVTCNLNFQASEVDKGCHSVTALVSHDFAPNLEPKNKNPPDLGQATWWFMVGVDPSKPNEQPGNCDHGELPRDGGADAEAGAP